MPETERWLSLGEAASRLGVHTSTLRRWSDRGDIPVFLTPGGHRRFSDSKIESFARERLQRTIVAGLEELLTRRAFQHTREGIAARGSESWMVSQSEEDKAESRRLGRQLMNNTLQYMVSEDGGELLENARALGEAYARHGRHVGLRLDDVLRASMFFRDNLIETAFELPERIHLDQAASGRLILRVNNVLNAVQLAIVKTYAEVG